MRFALEALQANEGDCLLLHYDKSGAAAVRVLLDGGPSSIYASVLKPRLDALRGDSVLDLRMVVVTHIDADHITGVLDLFRKLTEMQTDGEDRSAKSGRYGTTRSRCCTAIIRRPVSSPDR